MTRASSAVPDAVVQALGGRQPTEQQWDAISAPLEPCVLIAGAGSGKTAVMTARIVWLIVNGHASPDEVLGLTFTNKAAAELLRRVRTALEPLGVPDGIEPMIATYHSFASSLIADYGLRAGLEPGASLLSEAQAWQLCADLYHRRTYEALEVRTNFHISYVRGLADDCSNHLVDAEALIAQDTAFMERVKGSTEKISRKVIEACRKRIELAGVVRDYQEAKRRRNVLDYGDQIRIATELAADPRVQKDFLDRFRFALLDEYQDTNVAQATMLSHLMPRGYPVMAVGDPDQNIYAWRGASLRNLLVFHEDFRTADDRPAAVKPLVVNFRSGSHILDLANRIIEGIPETRRPPGKVLTPWDERGTGEVAVFLAPDQAAEARRIADEAIAAHDAGTPWGEIAILCRKKRLFDAVVETFREREIPLEVIGLGGLLAMPEVTDLVSLLRVIDDPMSNVSLARLLLGPRWRLGYRDLALIARHASQVNRDLTAALPGDDETPGDVAFSLAEAIQALDDVEGVSAEARERIADFNAMLATLRAATHLPLPELVAQALDALGLVDELAASPSPAAPAARRNLANFLDRVASFEPLDGEATLGALVEWLDAVEEADEEIEAAQPTDADAVKMMTIHQAKGLEFDVVFVPGLAAGERSKLFPDTGRQANPATSPRYLPFELRGDKDVLPTFMGNLTAFNDDLKLRAMEEERRLFYVAITRARKRLVCSAAHWYYPSGMGETLKTPMGPSDFWKEVRMFPHVQDLGVSPLPEENPLIDRRRERAMTWPTPARRPTGDNYPDGLAAAVKAARAQTPPDETLFPMEPAASTPPAPRSVAVTSLVTYASCPQRFYWTTVRPLPRRFNAAARVGTIVHSWIEQRASRQMPLVDPDAYEQPAPGVEGSLVSELKQAYLGTRFAGIEPLMVEQPFALVVGDVAVQGKIDAIFPRAGGGWEIVDFKTGNEPAQEGPEVLQLELYALAAQEIWGKHPEELTLTFAYIRGGTERSYEARAAGDIRKEISTSLERIVAGMFEPAPSAACGHCDFLLDCAPGREHLGR